MTIVQKSSKTHTGVVWFLLVTSRLRFEAEKKVIKSVSGLADPPSLERTQIEFLASYEVWNRDFGCSRIEMWNLLLFAINEPSRSNCPIHK